jgi:hypothetical protein
MKFSPEEKELAKYVGLGAVTGVIGIGLGLSGIGAAAVGFGSVALMAYKNRGRSRALPVSGDVEDAGDKLLSFFRTYGVPHYACQPVADFQSAAGIPMTGRYDAQTQMALAMSRTSGVTTIPNATF